MLQIGTDFQGWPVYALTLREILNRLGFEEDTETITLKKSEEANRLLDSYPQLLEDDGMGYGVNAEYITEVSDETWEKKILTVDYKVEEGKVPLNVKKVVKEEAINVFTMFREPPENKTEEDRQSGQ